MHDHTNVDLICELHSRMDIKPEIQVAFLHPILMMHF